MLHRITHIATRLISLSLLAVCFNITLVAQEQITANYKLTPLPNAYGQIIDPSADIDNGLVIIFTNHNCSYSHYYIERLNALNQELEGKGIKLIAIESSIDSFESTSASLKAYISENEVTFSYLIDLENETAASFGVQSSPHSFYIIPSGANYEVLYEGSIDNNSRRPQSVTKDYLNDAIRQNLAGEKIKYNNTKVIGCDLRKN